MPQYTSGNTLQFMVARVLQVKPNAQQSEVVNSINARIREVIDYRIYWSDLLARRVISFPAAYITGSIAFNTGSTLAIGTGTGWPVSDVVNTTSPVGVQDFGFQEITPSSMSNIAIDTLLFCDAGATYPETVAVVEVTPTSFWARFNYAHDNGFTITSSSLAGLQLNSGDTNPIFSVRAIRDATTLEMDQPWGNSPLTGVPYQVLRMYVTIDPLLKVILSVVDPQMGIPLETYVPLEKLDAIDPGRSSQQNPLCLAQHSPTEAGTMRYEVYPTVTSTYQLLSLVGLQWPDLKLPEDRAPWFIDPNLFVMGASADVLRIKNLRNWSAADPYYNPQVANDYEQRYRIKLQECSNADESKAQRAFSSMDQGLNLGMAGGNYWVDHDLNNLLRNF